MPYLLECFRKGEMPILKTPHAVWDYIHVEDVAAATLAALAHPEARGVFNLGTGQGHSVGDIAEMLGDMLKFKDMDGLRAQINAAGDRPMRRVADIGRIKEAMRWKPAVELEEGLKQWVWN